MAGSGMAMNPEMARMWALADTTDATIVAESDGAWSDVDTWNIGRTPTAGDRVYIPQGQQVTFDIVSNDTLRTLRLDGTLAFATDQDTTLVVDTLIGGMQSVLTLGTQLSPIDAGHSARLVFKDYDDPDVTGDGGFERGDSDSPDFDPAMLGLGLLTHGRFESAGSARIHGGSLTTPPEKGDTHVVLNFDPIGWQVGDEIVIAGTTLDALGDEKRRIVQIEGRRITLNDALDKNHNIVAHTKAGLDLVVHVINLERNVIIETADTGRAATRTGYTYTNETLNEDFTIDLFEDRGHVMFMHSNNVAIRYTRFHALGRTNKHGAVDDNVFDDDGVLTHAGMNPRARYPLHFHRAGLDGPPGLVEGSVADDSPGWCFVNHGSNASFKNNVAYDCDGASFVTERGDELGSFIANISIRNTADEGKRRTALRFQARKSIDDFGFGGHGFWFQGINVTATDNISTGAGREAFALYPLLFDNAEQSRFTLAQIAPGHQPSFTNDAVPDEVPVHTFDNNVAYGSNIGLMIGEHRPDAISLIEGFTAWMVQMGTSFNYSDSIRFDDLTLIGNLDTPKGLGAFAHHGTAQVTMNRPHVEGFAIGIQLPRAGNQAVDLARFKYSAVRNAYLNNVLNLHVLQIRSHDFLHADIEQPTFGTLSASALTHGIQALAAIDQTDDLDIDASNVRSNGFAELANEVSQNRFTTQQDYYLHYTQTAGPTVDTRHQRDSFLPRRITVTHQDGKVWRLFFKDQQQRDFIPFPTSIYKAGVDYDLNSPLDPDAPGNNRNSNLPAEYLDQTVGQIADRFQRDAANPHWADFAWAKDRTGSRWAVDAAVDYPGFALAPGGRLLPSDYEQNPRFAIWPRTSNLVAMRVDDLPDYIDYAGRDLEDEAQVLDADDCTSASIATGDCLSELIAIEDTIRRFDDEPGNGRSLLVDGSYDYAAPFSLEHKSFTWQVNLRLLNTMYGVVIDAGDAGSGFRAELVDGKLQVALRNVDEHYMLESGDLTVGNWIHVALMVNQGLGDAVLAINGQRVDSVDITPFRSSGGNTWRIGGPRNGSFGDTLFAYIDNLRFSERSYTDDGLGTLASVNAMPSPLRASRDADEDGHIDTLDRFPLNADEHTDSDDDGIGDTADIDDDNDGLPDDIETHYGLDPISANDAANDLDRDGINNLDEYLSGTRLDHDDVPPWVHAPDKLRLPARGALTTVELGVAVAGDARDGQLTAAPSPTGPYAPGAHEITWSVQDAAGNQARAIQQVEIQPQLFISGPAMAVEDSELQLTFLLNGDAVRYPVLIPYRFEGTADEADFSPSAGTVEIASGRETTLTIQVKADTLNEGDDTLVLVLETLDNAVHGNDGTHTIILREANLAPQVALTLLQDGETVDTLESGTGEAQLFYQVSDANPDDTHTLDWSASDTSLLDASSVADNYLSIDLTRLDAGSYIAVLTATDDGDGQLTGTAQFSVVVRNINDVIDLSVEPMVEPVQPTDATDTVDPTDLTDANIPGNPVNPGAADNAVASVVADSELWRISLHRDDLFITTTPGHILKPGTSALAAEIDTVELLSADHTLLEGVDDVLHEAGSPNLRLVGPIIDIEIHDVSPGGAATLVLPIATGVPGDARLRHLSYSGNWLSLDTSGEDDVTSLRADANACPVASDSSYVSGLHKGDHCIALRLVDGGDNDADGMKDGVVRLLFGLGYSVIPEPQIAAARADALLNTSFTQRGEHVVLAFSLSSDDIGAELHGLELATTGDLNEVDDVDTVVLYADRNGNGIAEATEALGRSRYTRDDSTLDFTLNSPYTLSVGDNPFLVTYIILGAEQ